MKTMYILTPKEYILEEVVKKKILCVVMGLEIRAFTLSHSSSLIFVKGFSR
jgi:hypothetical protein